MSRNRHFLARIPLLPVYGLVVAVAAEALSPTTITLNSSSNPANYGQPVTLTATVSSGATGKVTFYDGTTILGIGTLAATTASITTTLLPSGTRSLRAYYSGDANNSLSTSATISQIIMPGASLGLRAAVNYSAGVDPYCVAVGDFNGDNKQDLVVANFNSNNVGVLLGNGDGTFKTAVNYTTGSAPIFVVGGDFNGDGKQDLAVANYYTTSISILLGNGDGTFQTATTVNTGSSARALAVGDFNSDGKADLAIAASSGTSNSMRVLLGNGDGTFQPPVNYAGPNSALSVAVADLNQDGKADLVFGGGSVYVLLGNGDGTFRSAVRYSAGVNVAVVAIGDFNSDGKPDLAASDSSYSGFLDLLLGNGDGTFQSAVVYSTGQYPYAVTAADLNGDGALDILYSSQNNNSSMLGTLPGYGNGTFQSLVTNPIPGTAYMIAVGDFNGDGKVDVVVPNYNSNNVGVLLGGAIVDLALAVTHGNGFTQSQTGAFYKLMVSNIGDLPSAGAVGVTDTLPPGFTATSIAGAGWTCALATLTCTRSDSLAAGASFPSILITVNVSNQAGSATDTATVSGGGDGNKNASDTTTVRFTTNISLTSSPNPSVLGHPVTLTAAVTTGTAKVTFYDGTAVLGISTISQGQATLTTSQLPSGSRSLTARFDGDSNFGPVLSPVRIQAVNSVSTNGTQPSLSYKVGSVPNSVAVGDFNRDGKPDLVTANANDVSVLLGNGDGTFQAAVSYAGQATANAVFVAVSDFNGDGKPDIAIAYSDGSLAILLGNGDGTFQNPTKVTNPLSSSYPAVLTVTDLNRDGLSDLVILGGAGVSVFLGNGDGTFMAPLTNTANGFYHGLAALGDLNNDGSLDIVFTNSSATPGVYVMLGNGDGTFQPPVTYTGASTYIMSMTTGDFNGDGKSDVLELYWVAASTLKGNGDGTLQSPISSNWSYSGGNPPWDVVIAGDFNSDGKLDFAFRGYYGSNFTVVFGNGDGTFQNATTYQTDGYSGGIVIADLNGDGRPDFVIANGSNNTGSTSTINVFLGGQFSGLGISSTHTGRFTAGGTGSYQITVNNPAFVVTSALVSVTDTLPAGLTATSISGDGWTCSLGTLTCTRSDALSTGNAFPPVTVNVAVAANLSPSALANQVSVSYNGAVNTASDATSIVLASTTALTASPAPALLGQVVTLTATVTGSAGSSGSVSFFDGGSFLGPAALSSGHATLATRLLPAGSRSLTATYTGDSTHSSSQSAIQKLTVNAAVSSGFAAPLAYPTGTGPDTVVSADFNGDGKTDLVTPNSTANTVSVLLGNGDGTFQSKVDYAVGTQPVAVVVGDFNGDGKQDLAVASQTGNSLSILLGNGDGTFQAASTIALNDSPVFLATSDFNQDSRLDLLITFNDSVKLLLGNGDATFQPPAGSLFYSANAAVAADFNRDGKPDVALLNNGSVYVLPGNGDGTFQPILYNSGNGYSSLAVGDLNGDGIPDVVTTSYAGVDVFLGNGDGTFPPYVFYASGTSPAAVAIADVNGDGKLDVVVSNSGGNTLSVLFGKGDGTLQPQTAYATGSSPQGIAVGDFNGDGRTDLAVANSQGNNVTILLGMLTSVLQVTSTHTGNFLFNQTGATYTITVTNGGPGATSGTLTVIDTLPSGLTATAISGTGWNCTLATLTCTQALALAVGAGAQPITVTVTVAANAPSQVTNMVTATAPGAVSGTATDATSITALPPPVPLSPPNGQTAVSLTASLTWSAATGATSYDVYFGTQSNPPLVTNTAATTYTPASLISSTVYYWRIVSKNAAGSATSSIWSFITQTQTQNQLPRALFRDTRGAIQMTTYPSPALSYAGGVFASDPSAAEDAGGNLFVTARDTSNSIWATFYNSTSTTWAPWTLGGGIIQGVPALALDTTGRAWIASRDTYNSYWLVSYSGATGFGTWMPLLGIFSTDPVITSCSDGSIYLIGKDNFNSLWSGHYTPGTGFQGWQFGGGIIKGKPSATCGNDNAVYIAAQDNFNSNWIARVSNNTWTGWFYGGAITSVPPRIAALKNGSEAIIILDATNVPWRTTFTEGVTNGWQPWTQISGILQDLSPAGVAGQLYLAGKAPNGDLWWWQQTGNQWTWIGNNGAAAGSLTAAPR